MMDDYQSSDRLLDRPDDSRLTKGLVLAIFSSVWGMFQFGYNTGVMNPTEDVIKLFYNESYHDRYNKDLEKTSLTVLWAFTVAIFAIGGMVGASLGPWCSDKFGRKRSILYNAPVAIIAAALMGCSVPAKSYEMLVAGRFIIGFHSGFSTCLVPMYNAEVATFRIRGALGTLNQLAVTVGLLLAQVFGLSGVLGSSTLWPILVAIPAVPALIQLIFLPSCVESPRYLLLTKRDEDAAICALRKLRNTYAVGYEVDEMYSEQDGQRQENVGICQLFSLRSVRWPLIISVVMHLSQQLSGINCIFYYSTGIFTNAGLSGRDAEYATLGVGSIMVVMTLISVWLMDIAGRRTLHLFGLAGMFFSSIIFTVMYKYSSLTNTGWLSTLVILCAFVFVICFAIGPGSIPWLIMTELFSQGPRPAAVGIAVLTNWSSNFIVGLVFPFMQDNMMDFAFLPFTVLLGVFFVFLFKYLPETKNRTFGEIVSLFDSGSHETHVRPYGTTYRT